MPVTQTMRLRSPTKLDRQMHRLIEALGVADQRPKLLRYTMPTAFEPALAYCHWNAWRQVNHEGGSVQSGWMLFQDKRANFAEAIFHTIWVTPDGIWRDVTPRADGEALVLFIPDPNRTIELARHDGGPALWTYDNAQLMGTQVVKDPARFLAVLMDGYTETTELWPW